MYQASSRYQEEIAKNGRTFEVDLRKDGSSIDVAVVSMVYTGGTNGDNYLSLGGAVSAYIDMRLRLPAPVLAKAEIAVYIRPVADPVLEWIPLGLFTCDRPSQDGEEVEITAYDRMIKLEVGYFSSLSYPASSSDILAEIATVTGVPVTAPSRSVSFPEKSVGLTCREVVSYLAQMLGGFAIIDRAGNLCIRQYTSYGASIPYGRYWDPFNRAEHDFELSGIKCATGSEPGEGGESQTVYLTVGNESKQIITFENPYMTQDVLDLVWRSLTGFTFRPGDLEAMGDPLVEPGDILTVYDESGTGHRLPVMSLTFDFDGGLSMAIQAVGEPESREDVNVKGPNARAVDRLATELLLAERVIAQKIDASEVAANYVTAAVFNGQVANFNQLNSDYITFKASAGDRLTAIEGDFQTLQTGTLTAMEARIGTLETGTFVAATGTISSLTSDIANIRSLLSGTAAATSADFINLNALNATIDSAMLRAALIGVLSVGDLAAGNISTDTFTVGSDDGALSIDGALMQFRDENDVVRIQIGRDANDNFTFALYDAAGTGQLINASGIQPSAVSDGLIVDRMVQASGNGYEGISANKLNISSVIGSINQAGGIKSTSIYFDEQGQTLSQIYTQLSQETSEAQSSAAQSAAAAQAALTAIEGISTLDAFGVFLSNDAHVVHTYSDGTGGDWRDCETVVTAVMGDTDVSGRASFTPIPSESVTGTWNRSTRTYSVTGMTRTDGYVDFDVAYGTRHRYLLLPSGARLLMPSGGATTIPHGAAHVTKRFSISKAPDGRVGLSYSLNCSALVIKRYSGTLSPDAVQFNAITVEDGTASPYQGIFVVYETDDQEHYTEKYRSTSPESFALYSVSASADGLRCDLLDSAGAVLDTQTIMVVADAGEIAGDISDLADDIAEVRESVQTTEQRLSTIETGVDGLNIDLMETREEIHTVTDGIIQWEPYETINEEAGTALLTARVLKAGRDVTRDYPQDWYTYYKKSEDGVEYLGSGYTYTVQLDSMGFSGEVQMVFTTYFDVHFLDTMGRRLVTPDGKCLAFYSA